jgi:FMN phosphatase YigB (HAD superfamily)
MMTTARPADPSSSDEVVFLLDVDNTLLDNDRLKDDLARNLRELLGDTPAAQFWDEYEVVRQATGVVDLPLTFERFERHVPDADRMAAVRAIIMDYPFATCLYPETLATLAHLWTLGRPVIVSDGDTTYQPHKIEQSGLAQAVEWQVVIYAHKEEHLDEILARWPASYYVIVDDKPRILAETKRRMPDRFVTVQVMQGHYALSGERFTPAPDLTCAAIGELQRLTLADLATHLERA